MVYHTHTLIVFCPLTSKIVKPVLYVVTSTMKLEVPFRLSPDTHSSESGSNLIFPDINQYFMIALEHLDTFRTNDHKKFYDLNVTFKRQY